MSCVYAEVRRSQQKGTMNEGELHNAMFASREVFIQHMKDLLADGLTCSICGEAEWRIRTTGVRDYLRGMPTPEEMARTNFKLDVEMIGRIVCLNCGHVLFFTLPPHYSKGRQNT